MEERLNKRLTWFVAFLAVLMVSSYSFLSYWEYHREFFADPVGWQTLLLGHGTAPQQYRVGVLFVANDLSRLMRHHLQLRHALALLDAVFLLLGVTVTLLLVTRTGFYRGASQLRRALTQLVTVFLLLFYLSWTFWYHKPETIANFASLSLAALLLSGVLRVPRTVVAIGMVLLSVYLGTIRADSGLALNLGVLLAACLPGKRALPMGRLWQGVVGGIGVLAVLSVEGYLKNVLYPGNPFSDSLFQLSSNLHSAISLFCVGTAFAPYFLSVWLARRRWQTLEGWEQILLLASGIEFLIFVIVARANEVRLFLPYPMVLLPTSAALLCRMLTESEDGVRETPGSGFSGRGPDSAMVVSIGFHPEV
jgi:hypothetical protein